MRETATRHRCVEKEKGLPYTGRVQSVMLQFHMLVPLIGTPLRSTNPIPMVLGTHTLQTHTP